MRIAHVISGLAAQSGGITTAVVEMLRWQAILGQDVTLITGAGSDTDVRVGGLREVGVDVREFSTIGPKIIRYIPKLVSHVRQSAENFDLFVIHGSYQYPAFAVSRCCKNAGIPYIFVPHGSLDPTVRSKHARRNRIIDFAYHDAVVRAAAAWHFTSKREQTRCERQIWRQAFVEPLGVDLALLPQSRHTGAFRGRYTVPPDAVLLLFVSRITRKKGIDILLNAFRRTAAENRNVYLALCGPVDPDMVQLVEEFRSIPGVGERLVLTGFVAGELKNAAFTDANYFVLPTYSENFGISVFEALAHGLPVITTTGMDLWEELASSGRVRIIEPNADALTEILTEVAARGWRPAASADDARNWLEANYSWRVRGANLIAHYSRTLKDWRESTGVHGG